MAAASDLGKGCAMLLGVLLVMLTGAVMFLFVYLPLRLAIGVFRLLGRGGKDRSG